MNKRAVYTYTAHIQIIGHVMGRIKTLVMEQIFSYEEYSMLLKDSQNMSVRVRLVDVVDHSPLIVSANYVVDGAPVGQHELDYLNKKYGAQLSFDLDIAELPAQIGNIKELTGTLTETFVQTEVQKYTEQSLTSREMYNRFVAWLSLQGYTVFPSHEGFGRKLSKLLPYGHRSEGTVYFLPKPKEGLSGT
jgi:hypothetical protein